MKTTIKNYPDREARSYWSIVLAGGTGRRMRPWIQSTFRHSVPAQYCRLFQNQSLFQRTISRVHRVMPDGNVIVVVTREHESAARGQLSTRGMRLLVQPSDKDTASAIYLALSHIAAYDERACVAIFPSGHYVHPESDFIGSMQRSVEISALIPHKIMLIGARPDYPDRDYSWIIPGPGIARFGINRLSYVAAIRQRVAADEVNLLTDAGGLWNTHIMVGNIEAFWNAGEECHPRMMQSFDRYRSAIGSDKEIQSLKALYKELQHINFGHDILYHVPHRLALFHLGGVHWSDWSDPDRVARSLQMTQAMIPAEALYGNKKVVFPRAPGIKKAVGR